MHEVNMPVRSPVSPARTGKLLLELKNLQTAYGSSQILFGIDLEVRQGEMVTLLGRNGMGKTTTIMSIMGLLPTLSGSITFNGQPIRGTPAYRIAREGIGLVPEGRRIFPNLTVRENLVATASNRLERSEPWTYERVLELFPRLGERINNYGNQLSGGEQQMLAVGRALMTNPELLILDEATEGLAPLIRMEIWRCLELLKSVGQSILVIDKNVKALNRIADYHYVIQKGKIAWHGNTDAFGKNEEIRHQYLGV
jgi:branched-chain amino acid transport system ATP-binding protein